MELGKLRYDMILTHFIQFINVVNITGLDSDVVQVESVVVSPDPPVPGEDLTVKVKANVQEIIEVRDSVAVVHYAC